MSYTTPQMNLLGITIGTDTGLTIENNYNTNVGTIDGHNHTSGLGVPITPAGLSISADLPFGGNNATLLRSVRFNPQSTTLSGASDLGCIYEVVGDLYYNDGSGNIIRITSGGAVNATSSGISSGSATASFISSVLVVNAAANTPANIQAGSILLGNNVAASKYLTLSPPNAMPANYTLVLPSIPATNSFVTLDTAGNLSTAGSITATQIAAGSIQPAQISPNSLSDTQIAAGGIGTASLANLSVTVAKAATATSSTVNWSTTSTTTSVSVSGGTTSITASGLRPILISMRCASGGLSVSNTTSGIGSATITASTTSGTKTMTLADGACASSVGSVVPFAHSWVEFPSGYPTGSPGTFTVVMAITAVGVSGTATAQIIGGTLTVVEL
jgi:hypothetical protein